MVHVSTQQEFSDADWRAVATADQSKKLKLLLSGLTTGTTRVLTIPDADGTIMLTSAIGVTVQGYDADLASWALITRASGFDTFTATPSSANLRSLLTDETGTGAAVFAGSPTFTGTVSAAAAEFSGLVSTVGVGAGKGTVLDDAAADLGNVSPSVVSLVFIWREGAVSGAALATCFSVRTSASPVCTLNFGFSTNIDVTTSNVTGTTGVDGRTTISATSGSLKIENRSGSTLAYAYLPLRTT